MKKIFLFFVSTLLFSILVHGVNEEHTLLATVSVNSVPGTLNVFPENLLVNAPPLSEVEKNLTFWQKNENQGLSVTLFLEISGINTWMSFSENNFIVKPNETKDITTFIDIPNVTTGTYSGNIHALTDSQDLLIPVNITVTGKYRIDVEIDVLERKVKAGNNVSVLTKLAKTKEKMPDPDVEGKITIDLSYNVMKGKDLIATLTATMDVENLNEKTVSINVPLNSTKGGYTVEAIAAHLDKTGNDKDNFQVTDNWVGRFFSFLRQLMF
mgnify:CR=1 FL=1